MSEFYFDYRCVCMGNKGGSTKALDMCLAQDFDTGEVYVQVHIPEEILVNKSGVRLYRCPGGIEFPDKLSDYREPTFISCSEYNTGATDETIDDTGCIFIRGNINGTGIIGFLEKDERYDSEPKLENQYMYAISFSRKQPVRYSIERVKKKGFLSKEKVIEVTINDASVRKPLELVLVRKKYSKPLLKSDYSRDNRARKDGKECSICLNPGTPIKETFEGIEESNEYFYRLDFKNEIDKRFYILLDESELLSTPGKSASVLNDEKRCPFCGKVMPRLPEPEKRVRTMIVNCQGQVITKSSADVNNLLENKYTVICQENNGRSRGQLSENLILPPNYATERSMIASVIGLPNSGKTVFLSSLFNMKFVEGTSIRSLPIALNEICRKFGEGTKVGGIFSKEIKPEETEEVRFDSIVERDGQYCVDTTTENNRRGEPGFLMRYVRTPGRTFESQTQLTDLEQLAWHPVGFKTGTLGYAFFYDVPGEVFTTAGHNNIARSIKVSDCFIVITDCSMKPDKIVNEINQSLDRAREMSDKNWGTNIPIAVVLTKHDLRLSDHVDPELPAYMGCFDENCYSTMEDISSLISKKKFKGTFEDHINRSSDELEHFIRAGGQEARSQLDRIKNQYPNLKFFACSPLGWDNSLGESNGITKDVLYKPKSLRMGLPLIWLMYQRGLIRE